MLVRACLAGLSLIAFKESRQGGQSFWGAKVGRGTKAAVHTGDTFAFLGVLSLTPLDLVRLQSKALFFLA